MIRTKDIELILSPNNISENNIKGKYIYSCAGHEVTFLLLFETKNYFGYWEYVLTINVSDSNIDNANFRILTSKCVNVSSGIHWELFVPILAEIQYFLKFGKFDKAKIETGNIHNNYLIDFRTLKNSL